MAGPSVTEHDRSDAGADEDPGTGLQFSEIIKNKTKSPFSLGEFMEYLLYVEHNAENLQFFLWYCDFVQRWSCLSSRQKALSPEWSMESDTNTERFRSSPLAAHKKAKSEKLANILAILERSSASEETNPDALSDNREGEAPTHGTEAAPTNSTHSPEYLVQPFRDELTQIARHYIDEGAPRQLSLSSRDRKSILNALRHTTHPTALLPAVTLTSNILREFSHPSFIKWSLSKNANSPRIAFARIVSAAVITLGLVLNTVLTLTGVSPYSRAFGILLLWPGITFFAAAVRGLSLSLHFRGLRQQRPWEGLRNTQDHVELGEAGLASSSPPDQTEKGFWSAASPSSRHKYHESWYGHVRSHSRKLSDSSPRAGAADRGSVSVSRSASVTRSIRSVDSVDSPASLGHSAVVTSGGGGGGRSTGKPTRARDAVPAVLPSWDPIMQPLGPSNDCLREVWSRGRRRTSLFRSIFAPTVAVRNKDLQLRRDRAILRCVVLGGLVSAVITCIFLFLPGGYRML